jgi:hypothetical protein
MLEREVQLIEHIRDNTSAPMPIILRYLTQLDNDYGLSYTFTRKPLGETAFSVYFHQPYDPSNPSGAY